MKLRRVDGYRAFVLSSLASLVFHRAISRQAIAGCKLSTCETKETCVSQLLPCYDFNIDECNKKCQPIIYKKGKESLLHLKFSYFTATFYFFTTHS